MLYTLLPTPAPLPQQPRLDPTRASTHGDGRHWWSWLGQRSTLRRLAPNQWAWWTGKWNYPVTLLSAYLIANTTQWSPKWKREKVGERMRIWDGWRIYRPASHNIQDSFLAHVWEPVTAFKILFLPANENRGRERRKGGSGGSHVILKYFWNLWRTLIIVWFGYNSSLYDMAWLLVYYRLALLDLTGRLLGSWTVGRFRDATKELVSGRTNCLSGNLGSYELLSGHLLIACEWRPFGACCGRGALTRKKKL